MDGEPRPPPAAGCLSSSRWSTDKVVGDWLTQHELPGGRGGRCARRRGASCTCRRRCSPRPPRTCRSPDRRATRPFARDPPCAGGVPRWRPCFAAGARSPVCSVLPRGRPAPRSREPGRRLRSPGVRRRPARLRPGVRRLPPRPGFPTAPVSPVLPAVPRPARSPTARRRAGSPPAARLDQHRSGASCGPAMPPLAIAASSPTPAPCVAGSRASAAAGGRRRRRSAPVAGSPTPRSRSPT
mmetsp:Transcript_9211/g.23438  ORF Transcript_9211/g.23438 Transcript_9211/m.23438 type:complete len:240 (-) Transcript_9211:255-974(-)